MSENASFDAPGDESPGATPDAGRRRFVSTAAIAGAAAAAAATLLSPDTAGADPVASNNVLLFDSSIVTPVGNSYNDWSDVVTAIAASGGPHTVQFVQNETIPAGTWNLGSLPTFTGTGVNWFYGGPTVTLDDGCTFTFDGMPGLIVDGGMLLESDSTDPIISTAEPIVMLAAERGAGIGANLEVIIEGTSSSPAQLVILRVNDNGWMLNGNYMGSSSPAIEAGAHPLVRVDDGLVVMTLGPGPVGVTEDLLEGTGADLYIVNGTTAPEVPIAQAGFSAGSVMSGPMTLVNTRAVSLGYTPDPGGGWSPAPTNVQAALDQLDARLALLE